MSLLFVINAVLIKRLSVGEKSTSKNVQFVRCYLPIKRTTRS